MSRMREDVLRQTLADLASWHADPTCVPRDRVRCMRRTSSMPPVRDARHINTVECGDSRLLYAEVKGAGTEGLALLVQQRQYYEHCTMDYRTVVKFRAIERTEARPSTMMLQTVAREVVQGLVAAHLRMPFVTHINDWWAWRGEHNDAIRRRPWHVTPGLPAGAYDVGDLLGEVSATHVRQLWLAQHRVPVPAGVNLHALYAQHRARHLATVQQLPLIVIEQPNAGDISLHHMVRDFRLVEAMPDKWAFLRTMVLSVAAMTAYLQHEYRWIHGDMSMCNIMLRSIRFGDRAFLPETFTALLRLPRFGDRENAADLGALDIRDFVYERNAFFPCFIDLSRSAMDPARVESLLTTWRVPRQPSFAADAVNYMDSDGRAVFSRTADMRRLGLSLAGLCVGAVMTSKNERHLPLGKVDWRVVRVARTLIDVPPRWWEIAQTADFRRRTTASTACTAVSETFSVFLTVVAFVVDYLARMERAVRRHGTPADADYVHTQAPVLNAALDRISADLNPYTEWLLLRHPEAENNDARCAANVHKWDVWYY